MTSDTPASPQRYVVQCKINGDWETQSIPLSEADAQLWAKTAQNETRIVPFVEPAPSSPPPQAPGKLSEKHLNAIRSRDADWNDRKLIQANYPLKQVLVDRRNLLASHDALAVQVADLEKQLEDAQMLGKRLSDSCVEAISAAGVSTPEEDYLSLPAFIKSDIGQIASERNQAKAANARANNLLSAFDGLVSRMSPGALQALLEGAPLPESGWYETDHGVLKEKISHDASAVLVGEKKPNSRERNPMPADQPTEEQVREWPEKVYMVLHSRPCRKCEVSTICYSFIDRPLCTDCAKEPHA